MGVGAAEGTDAGVWWTQTGRVNSAINIFPASGMYPCRETTAKVFWRVPVASGPYSATNSSRVLKSTFEFKLRTFPSVRKPVLDLCLRKARLLCERAHIC